MLLKHYIKKDVISLPIKYNYDENQELGRELSSEEKLGTFLSPEGSANLYYGLIRSGKTYGATADILEELKQGRLVYGTWPILTKDFDDRKSLFMIIKNILSFKKVFYAIPCQSNYHYINAETGEVDGVQTFNPTRPSEYLDYLNSLNNCSLYIDEAWRVIDSYKGTNFSVEGRDLILVTGHKNRTVNLIAQRPTSVHVTARGNMNRFYKFQKIATWPWIRFARYEFQEMSGETVNEDLEPISIKKYWGSKEVFDAYNTHEYGGKERLHTLQFRAFELTFKQKCLALYQTIRSFLPIRHKG